MNTLTNFIQINQIDSFQKLNFLLLLQRYPELKGTSQEFADRLYLGDTLLLEKIIRDLQAVGLLVGTNQRWQLTEEPAARASLQHLARAFESPLARQELLGQIDHGRQPHNHGEWA